ncbi:MAG TPA: hypothetical protein VGS21_02235, partial [Acidimicrobiales bacterium]|nr:hypothetical protein [Acidimicrobiales bacterium]
MAETPPRPHARPPDGERSVSEGRRTGAWTGVALFVLLAIAVAISTRTAANASSGRGFGGNSATEPEILAMGGYVPTAQQMGGARFSVAGKQLRTRNLGAVDFVTDMEGVAVGNSLILTTHDGGTNWLSPAIPSIGETLDVVSCSTAQHCVAGGYGQSGAAAIFATVDAGSSWEPAKFPGGLADLQFLSCGSAGDCVAVGQPAGSAMWELTSTDGGQSWESGQAPAMAIVKSVECTGPSACVVGGSSASDRGSASGTGVIETSGDGGRSWTNASTPTVAAICAVPFGSNSVSCNGPLGPAQSGAMTPIWPVYGISCPDTSTCLAVSSSGPTLVSTDTGSTWQAETEAKVVCPDGTSGANCTEALLPVGIDFVSPTVGYMTTVDQCGGFNFETESFQSCPATVMTTTDAGVTWHVRASTDYLSAMSCPDATHCWAATSTSSGGGLIATSDGGAAWSQVPVAETGELFNTTCLTATVCLASGADADGRAVIERSTDGGRTYSPVAANAAVPNAGAAGSLPYVGSDANYISGIACPTTTTCIASSNAGLIRSGDAGRTWSRAGPEPKGSFSAYAVTCAGPATCLSGTSAGLLRTTDDGVTWQAVKVSGVSFATFVDCSPSGLCVLNQVSSTSIYVSRDAGATWARVQLPGAGGNVGSDTSLPAVAAMSCWDQADCDVVGWSYVSGGAGGAYQWYLVRTTDGGVTWSASILRAPITNVGSLSCSTNANCLIAGSVANGTALWALDGTQISPLPTPSWGAYGFLASLVCPKVDRCIGTAMSDDAVTTFSVTVTGAATAPGWTSSLPSPREAFSNIGDDVGSA